MRRVALKRPAALERDALPTRLTVVQNGYAGDAAPSRQLVRARAGSPEPWSPFRVRFRSPIGPDGGSRGTVNLMGCGRNDARNEAGDIDGYAVAATPVTAAQV